MEGRLLFVMYLLQTSLISGICSITPTEYENAVDQTLQQVMTCASWIPGLTVAVVKDSQTLFTRGYGRKEINSDTPVTEQTLFQIGSVSKSFAATLLAKQLQNANLGFSTKIKDLMDPGFYFVDDERTQEATVVDVLAHRMGVPDHTYLRLNQVLTRANLVNLFDDMTPVKNFRTSFLYSNMMYGFATYLSEKLNNGNTWENLMASEIFQPLGMTSSRVVTTIPDLSNAAQGYDKAPGGVVPVPLNFSREWGIWSASGAIMSNAVDMTKYMNLHLYNKDKNNVTFMSSAYFDALHEEHIKLKYTTVNTYFGTRVVPTKENGYGLGWKRGTYRENDIWLHSGSTFGYRSFITLFPNEKIGIFTSMTGEDDNYILRVLLHNFLSDVALGVTPWLDAPSICAELTAPKYTGYSNTNNPKRNLDEYVGLYINPIYGNLNVMMDPNNDHLILKYGIATWDLWTKSKKDTFKAEGKGMIRYLINLYNIKFLTTGNDITAVEFKSLCKSCGSSPPIFTKTAN